MVIPSQPTTVEGENVHRATNDHLAAHHAHQLAESAISEEVSAARGYRTVRTKAELERLGFSNRQRRVPALLIPIRNTVGEIATYQVRPDDPRINGDKAIKYETPKGSGVVVDVPPAARAKLRDQTTPLFITEGAKKADSGVSHGLCTVALLGVWNWRGKQKGGGKATLPDWDDIVLDEREVYIVFDSDVMVKVPVHQAMSRLKAMLERRGANVEVIYLPDAEGAGKVGLDDFFAAGGTVDELLALASKELKEPPAPEPEDATYVETKTGIVWNKQTKDAVVPVVLTNFTARIIAQVEESDGVETTRQLEIESRLAGRTRCFEVPAQQFAGLGWVMSEVGAGAILTAGQSLKDHTRAAIQHLSGGFSCRTAFAHTGWAQIESEWHYLHAGGSIGPHGPRTQTCTRLSGALALYRLPAAPTGEDLVTAIRASRRLLDVAPPRISCALFATTYRAALGDIDASTHATGPTGTLKTEVGAVCQGHWGSELTSENVPGSWSSTDNALEMQAFLAKDALYLIDDFAPTGTQYDIAAWHKKADRVLRAQGNRSGRGRLRKDSKPMLARPPRGMILSTGEDVPAGQSLRARLNIVEISPGDIDSAVLSELQAAARKGLLAQSMAGFIAWVAPRYEAVQERLRARELELRNAMKLGTHLRTPTNTACLMAGFEVFLAYAQSAGALTADETEEHRHRCWEALVELAEAQVAFQASSEPTAVFFHLLSSALSAGRVHIEDINGGHPDEELAAHVGWKQDRRGDESSWKPCGDRVGWIEGDAVLLLPAVAHKAAQSMGAETEKLTIGVNVLGKRLHEKRLLLSRDEGRDRNVVRRQIGDVRPSLLHVAASSLGIGAHGAQRAQTGVPGTASGGGGPETWAQNIFIEGVSGPRNGPTARPPDARSEGCGPDGPIGPQTQGVPRPGAQDEDAGEEEEVAEWRA